jgi:hypothetical protein
MRAVVVAEVAASVAVGGDFTEAVAAIAAERIRHIPSQAARVVPDMDTPVVPVVRATRSQAGGIIADTAGQQWEPQRLVLRPMALMALTATVTMRMAIGSAPISIGIDADRMPTAVGWRWRRSGARRLDSERWRMRIPT